MPLPVLNEEQRRQALEKAAEARRKRAEVKAELKSGKRTLSDILNDQGMSIPKVPCRNCAEFGLLRSPPNWSPVVCPNDAPPVSDQWLLMRLLMVTSLPL